ncbi:DJ-1 family protein [Candidatus Aerophobetes bacterium]|uniref:DJ-1 family protein n=1 Tax=Aerophobetes bacterium TaxID=2030807 RepID=A0A662CZ64_UNCAE|nr:MAG: DJ-1 family protein [Candidatus Aerophobetes bacterium]
MYIKGKGVILGIILLMMGMFCSNASQGGEKMTKLTEKKAVMIIAERNFRDEELLKPKEILEKRGVKVTVASTSLNVAKGMLGARVKPDILVKEIKVDDYDAIIFVGGSGASQYWNDPLAHNIAKETVKKNKILCAICIAPVTLANAGVLSGKKATVWPSEKGKLEAKGASYTGNPVQVEGKIITAEGPQAAEEFGRSIVEALSN